MYIKVCPSLGKVSLLATQTFIEHLHAKTGHTLCAIWPIGVWAHLVFNGEHSNSVEQRPQDAGQCEWIAINETSSFLAPLHHFHIAFENGF
jgi:hypothetical protein